MTGNRDRCVKVSRTREHAARLLEKTRMHDARVLAEELRCLLAAVLEALNAGGRDPATRVTVRAMDKDDLPDELVNGSVNVVFEFSKGSPAFGDLFLLTGEVHSRFPPHSGAPFQELSSLGFRQVDDYFAIADADGEPTIWLYPMLDGHPVHHHPGPFSGINIEFNLLAHPVSEIEVFLSVIDAMSRRLDAQAFWGDRREPLTKEALVPTVKNRLDEAMRHWERQGITPGSEAAITISLE